MTVEVLRDVQSLVGVLESWHRDNWSEDLRGLWAENRFCRCKHLLIMMNFIAGGRCLHIEAIVLRNMLVHVR